MKTSKTWKTWKTWKCPEISSQVNLRVRDSILRFIYLLFGTRVWTLHTAALEQIKKATRSGMERHEREVKRISSINTNDLQIKLCIYLLRAHRVDSCASNENHLNLKKHIFYFSHICAISIFDRRMEYDAKIRTMNCCWFYSFSLKNRPRIELTSQGKSTMLLSRRRNGEVVVVSIVNNNFHVIFDKMNLHRWTCAPSNRHIKICDVFQRRLSARTRIYINSRPVEKIVPQTNK